MNIGVERPSITFSSHDILNCLPSSGILDRRARLIISFLTVAAPLLRHFPRPQRVFHMPVDVGQGSLPEVGWSREDAYGPG